MIELAKTKQTVKLDASTVEIEERGVKLRLTVVDTPGFGDAIDNSDRYFFLKNNFSLILNFSCLLCKIIIYSFRAIIQYIDEQYERFLKDESGLNRRHIIDNRVHCCFYFVSPFGHG